MYRKVAIWALLLLLLLAGVGGYLLGVNRQNAELNDLRDEVARLRDRLQQEQNENKSALRTLVDGLCALVGSLLWVAWRLTPLAVVGTGLWAVYALVDKRRRTYYPNPRGQLPAVERRLPGTEKRAAGDAASGDEATGGESALIILDQQVGGGVSWGPDGVRAMEQPLGEGQLLELAAMVNAVRAAAAVTSGEGQWKVKPVDPLALLNTISGPQRRALPEVRVVRDVEIADVIAQLEGPDAHLLAERLEDQITDVG
jgi:hypothetical protein